MASGTTPFARSTIDALYFLTVSKLALKLGEERNLKRSEIADWQPLLDYCAGNPLTLRVLVGQAVKASLRSRKQIEDFVQAIRTGEQTIEDADENQGRDKSLGASLDYGFRNAFKGDDLPIIALLHLFEGTVDVDILHFMGEVGEHALPELKGKSKKHLSGLLDRAKDTGLLTHLHATWFTIHPALPWFLRQLFARHYDGQKGRSASQAAIRAWVEAVGALGNYYHGQFNEGNRGVTDILELEEANLLHARRLARRNQWWDPVTSCMQGLRSLYEYQGRTAEWARLVEEIVSDYCTADDEPISDREDAYTLVMDYRVRLARHHKRDLAKAAALQEKRVESDRRQAATVLALPADAPLDKKQRNRLRTLAMSHGPLGQILQEAGNTECLQHYQEAIRILRRIADKPAEAVAEFNLGHAYMQLPSIRDLDAAEAAYRRSLDLCDPNDALGRSKCIKQIGMVHHERFRDAREHEDPPDTLLRHVQAAQNHYLDGLRLCPKDALTVLAPIHGQLGTLYAELRQIEDARDHYEQATQYFEKMGDHLSAGSVRFNIALMYAQASQSQTRPSHQRDYLLRARAYAQAALRDFQHYQGRAAEKEANTQALLDKINKDLANLPQ